MNTMTRPWNTNEAGDREAELDRERHLMISYPFPVADAEMIANLRLPKYLSRVDADRLKAVIDTLIMEPAPF